MRRDITELKQQLESMRAMHAETQEHTPYYTEAHEVPVVQQHIAPAYDLRPQDVKRYEHLPNAEEYVEEALSLNDVEKKTILMALERNRGKRRNAAKELNISERTLYRKIKEYGIE